jgi:hypothetical protein
MGSALQPPFVRATERIGSLSADGLARLIAVSSAAYKALSIGVIVCFCLAKAMKFYGISDAMLMPTLVVTLIGCCVRLRQDWKERVASRGVA